jgi:hypothetical protein
MSEIPYYHSHPFCSSWTLVVLNIFHSSRVERILELWYSTGGTRRYLRGYVDYTICITCIMYQQLWRYKVEDKLYLGVREQKMLYTTVLEQCLSTQTIAMLTIGYLNSSLQVVVVVVYCVGRWIL